MGSVLTICLPVMESLIVRTNQMKSCFTVVSVEWILYHCRKMFLSWFNSIKSVCLSLFHVNNFVNVSPWKCASEANWLDCACQKMRPIIIYPDTRVFTEEYHYSFLPLRCKLKVHWMQFCKPPYDFYLPIILGFYS